MLPEAVYGRVDRPVPAKLITFAFRQSPHGESHTSAERRKKRPRLEAPDEVQRTESDTELPPDSYIVLYRRILTLVFSPDAPLADEESPPWHDDGLIPLRIQALGSVSYGSRLTLCTIKGGPLFNERLRSLTSQQFRSQLVNVTDLAGGPLKERHLWGPTEIARADYRLVRPADPASIRWTIQIQVLWRRAASYGDLVLPVRLPFRYLLASLFPAGNRVKKHVSSAQIFYESADSTTEGTVASNHVRVEDITCELYPFQKRSVRWLLRREGVDVDENGLLHPYDFPEADGDLPPTFMRGADASGGDVVYSHLYGAVTTDPASFRPDYVYLKGGILAEEMGLGKTVELIALICLHPRNFHLHDASTRSIPGLLPAKTTLVITPRSILQQWLSEIARHAPHLKVHHYKGLKGEPLDTSEQQIAAQLVEFDVVITSYDVLSSEVHYANDGLDRVSRYQKKYAARRSPLLLVSWWRFCLDEAQMIETGFSGATRLARLIPRCNAWAVTGTPVRGSLTDLLGLFSFLLYEPFCRSPAIWEDMLVRYPDVLRDIISKISLRHSKAQVRGELHIPPQSRFVIKIPFTHIEEQHYSELYQLMCDKCGYDRYGRPLISHEDIDQKVIHAQMRAWLVRLRQTCLHPRVGQQNRQALGHVDGRPLSTVDEVLAVMINQNEALIRFEERHLIEAHIRKGQLWENLGKSQRALDIWLNALRESQNMVAESRTLLALEMESLESQRGTNNQSEDHDDEEDETSDQDSQVALRRKQLRAALELEHMCSFFAASAYYQIKRDESLTEPESDDYKDKEKAEVELYEKARQIRQEMIIEIRSKAGQLMERVSKQAEDQSFEEIPEIKVSDAIGGLESRRLREKLSVLGQALNDHANQLDVWRENVIQLLLRPLVDQEDTEADADAFDRSTKEQEELYAYMEAIQISVTDRHAALTGLSNEYTRVNIRRLLELARQGEGHSPALMIALLKTRDEINPSKELGSVREIISELRGAHTSLRWQARENNSRANTELVLIEKQLKDAQQIAVEQGEAITGLERELLLLRNTQNARLEYYKQLQNISDTVGPYVNEERDDPHGPSPLEKIGERESQLSRKIATLKGKHRYLLHLRAEESRDHVEQICLICKDSFEMGGITTCGHVFCAECIRLWWTHRKRCPKCTTMTSKSEIFPITYKPEAMNVHQEAHSGGDKTNGDSNDDRSSTISIFNTIDKSTLDEIKNIDLNESYGSKIDTMVRHLLWIRTHDPGAKSVIFSQFRDFLDVLQEAFDNFKIGFSSVDSKDGIQRFKEDASIEVFLLHAKAQSSGLNLVNATHVLLCEPLLNTALELQAIARVHRIGQQRPTTVWMFIVNDTVEEYIYDLSVKRRLMHIQHGRRRSVSLSPPQNGIEVEDEDIGQQNGINGEVIDEEQQNGINGEVEPAEGGVGGGGDKVEEANSLELQKAAPLKKLMVNGQGGGERVNENDLWACLFNDGKTIGRRGGGVDV
ncbi:MAG: hypothetical protein M1823_002322 [Watsoniomyces obsoletus]|nr:MAG: hypothetical protein M1823_002322 [Watsoniomyces obsoletus]